MTTPNEFVLSSSKKNEAARIVHGLAFLTELKKTAAPKVDFPQSKDGYTPSPASAITNPSPGAAQQFKSPSTQAGVAVRGPGSKAGISAPRMKKRASLEKAAILKTLVNGVKSDLTGLKESAEGYRAGLQQFSSGGGAKPDMGSAWDRLKAFVTRKPTREQAAYARGPDYYNAFIRAKNMQKGTGVGDLVDEVNASIRNSKGEITPLNVMRGAVDTGLISQDSLKDIAKKATDYVSGAGEEAARAERNKRMLQGAGLAGGGLIGGGLIARGMSNRDAKSK